MTIELKIKLTLWEIKSNHKSSGKELFEELRYEMQYGEKDFRNYIEELANKGFIKIFGPNKDDFGDLSLTIDGEKLLAFSEEEKLDIILDYCTLRHKYIKIWF